MINWWNAGGLIEVSPSIPNPETGAYSGATPIPLTGNFPDLYTNNGNAMNTALNGYLDQLATSLLVLQNAGVVVLFRPYHEMNQPFFWWGASGTTSQFKLLWQYTFTYLTQTKGLHNLLFVWAPFYQNAGSILGKYPGDAYVDVVAIDAYDYMGDQVRYPGGKHLNYDELVATGKPFALAEFGLQHYGGDPPLDLNAAIQRLRAGMPRTVYFMLWNENWAMNLQTNASAALNDPWVQNRPVPFNISDALSHVAVPPTIGSADVTLAFTNPAYGVRYWTNTIPVTEISSLGGVLTYHQSIAWSGETTFYCAAAQGNNGVWENDVNPLSYLCNSVDLAPPTTPSNVVAKPTASAPASSLNVTWDVSVDTGSGMASYDVERCYTAPCTNFQLASVTGIVPSAVLKDLPAETTVNIRVRARDIAGNVSPYSSNVQGTTAPAASASTSDPHAPAAIRAHEEYSPSTSKLPSFSGQ
jgi:beta-mannanase